MPLIELEMPRPTYVFAAVDHTGADITSASGEHRQFHQHRRRRLPGAQAGHCGLEWLRRLPAHDRGSHPHELPRGRRRLTRLVDEADPEVVFLCGEVRSRTDVVAELPERVAQRVSQLHAGTRKSGIDEEEVRHLTAAEFARRRGIEMTDIADRFEAEIGRGSGLAAEGLAAVCAALRDGDVDTLIIGQLGDATVVTGNALTTVAPDADVLSGSASRWNVWQEQMRHYRSPQSQLAPRWFGPTAGWHAADGIGALLRYVATTDSRGQAPRFDFECDASALFRNFVAWLRDFRPYRRALTTFTLD